MPTSTATRLHLIFAFGVIYVVWGSTYLAIRVAVETMPPFLMAAVRFAVAGGVLYTVCRLRGVAQPTRRQWRNATIIGLLLLLGGNGAVVWAEQYLSSGIAALLIGACPVFVVLADWIWPGGTRPTASLLLALGVGFAGAVGLVAPWGGEASAVELAPLLAMLLGCVAWAVGSIASRRLADGSDVFLGSALQMLCGSAGLLVAAGLHGDFTTLDLAAISLRSWGALLFLTLVGSLVGFSAYVWLLKHSSPARVATHAYVNPVVALLLGWLLLDEVITTRTLIASAVIIGAVAVITWRRTRPGGAAEPARLRPPAACAPRAALAPAKAPA